MSFSTECCCRWMFMSGKNIKSAVNPHLQTTLVLAVGYSTHSWQPPSWKRLAANMQMHCPLLFASSLPHLFPNPSLLSNVEKEREKYIYWHETRTNKKPTGTNRYLFVYGHGPNKNKLIPVFIFQNNLIVYFYILKCNSLNQMSWY